MSVLDCNANLETLPGFQKSQFPLDRETGLPYNATGCKKHDKHDA